MNVQLNLFESPGELGKPFLKSAGGKGRFLYEVLTNLPHDIDSCTTYIDPFVGYGEVLFNLLNNYTAIKQCYISDANIDLLNLYKLIKCFPDDLINELMLLQHEYFLAQRSGVHAAMYSEIKAEYNNRTIIERVLSVRHAALFIFLNKTALNALYHLNSKKQFSAPFGKYKYPIICDIDTILTDNRLMEIVDFIDSDEVDFLDLINEDTFVYLNPPSIAKIKNDNLQSTINDSNQEELKSMCDRIHLLGAKFLLCTGSELKEDFNLIERYNSYTIIKMSERLSTNTITNSQNDIKRVLVKNY